MENCKTCGQSITDAAKFCPSCGAKQVFERLTIPTLLRNLFLRLTNLDFSFFRTSKWLVVNPKLVAIGYINGVRRVISSPIQYALIVLSIYGLFQFLFSDFLNLILENNFLSGFRDGWNNYDTPETREYEQMDMAVNWIQSRNQFFLFAMIPCIGFFSRMLYRSNGYNLAEHLVVSTYAVSFTLLLSVFIGLVLAPLGNETAATLYLEITYILNAIAITWIFKRSLNGSIFKPIGVLVLSFLGMSFLFFFVFLGMFV